MKTLTEILTDVNAVIDLDATMPTGTELTTRANYANQAVYDASATGVLSEFKREYLTTSSTLATISLPTDFRELQDDPRIYVNGSWVAWQTIDVEQKYDRSTLERYCYVMGDPASGYNLIFNNIEASDNLSIVYQRYPSGMPTLTSVCELSDPMYVVRKIESYVLYSRSDDRFNIAEQRAEQQLANMMGREMKSSSGMGRDTKMKFQNPLA